MKKLGKYNIPFPENKEDAAKWEPLILRVAVARKVLIVANTRIEGAWCAYIDAVPGQNHDMEAAAVLRHGTKLYEPWARVFFSRLDGVPYAH